MRILVTGGAGFIGSNFIRYWLKEHPQDEIVNFDKLTYSGNLENLKEFAGRPNYQFVRGDIADAALVDQVMPGIEVVVNFAAESHVDRSILGPSEFIKTNVIGTQVLLDAAIRGQIRRFHHISTDEVFGDAPLGSPMKFNESSPLRPSSPYAASKAASDLLVGAYARTYNLPMTISNCSNNYGPYQFPEKFLALMITNALEDKPLPIYGQGLNLRDWLYVLDHCKAIDMILQKGRVGSTYCLGADEEHRNRDVAKKILQIMGKPESLMTFVKDRPGHDLRYPIESKKIRQELGWKPEAGFEEGLQRTIDWYKNNEQWWRPLKEKNQSYYKKQYG